MFYVIEVQARFLVHIPATWDVFPEEWSSSKPLYVCERLVRGNMEGNVLFKDTLSTFYLWLYGIGYMVKDHSDSERGNLLSPRHSLLFSISIKESFICTIPETG